MYTARSSRNRISRKALSFTESVIREISREAVKYGAVNLGQGFPDWPAPADIKQKAVEAILDDHNQYAVTWGVKGFRDAIAKKIVDTLWCAGFNLGSRQLIRVAGRKSERQRNIVAGKKN